MLMVAFFRECSYEIEILILEIRKLRLRIRTDELLKVRFMLESSNPKHCFFLL